MSSEAQEFQVRKVFDPATFSVVEEFVPTGKTVEVEVVAVEEDTTPVEAVVEVPATPKPKRKRGISRKKKSS